MTRPTGSLSPDDQATAALAEHLKEATAAFLKLRDDASSNGSDFNAAAAAMDAIYESLISRRTGQLSIVALQFAAVDSRARMHAIRGEEPDLDEALSYADFARMVGNLVTAIRS